MQSPEGYGAHPMDLHVSAQGGYHAYYRKGGEEDVGPPPVQTRILEMRKEKSRDAARSRRGKENYEFYELAKMLPLPPAITSQLDKASIIRLTISYLKLKEFTAHGDPPWNSDGNSPNKPLKSSSLRHRSANNVTMEMFENHQATHILQSLDGFAFALGADGRFLYISETVSIYLGLSQVEMTGSSVFDYIHQQDHAELAEHLGINLCQSPSVTSPASVVSDDGSSSTAGPSTPTGFDRPPPVMTLGTSTPFQGLFRSFCIRMKSTLTKRGCHFKSSGYRVVLVLSHLRPQYTFSHTRKHPPTIMGMVALAIALPPPSINEVRLESDMFVIRLGFDFRIAHCEPRVSEILDYTADELTGRSMYAVCHGQDVQKIRKCHVDLIQKGQTMSAYYRFLNKSGGYTWIQTCATVICNTKNAEEETIICINYVVSRTEFESVVLDCCQMNPNPLARDSDNPQTEKITPATDKDGRDSVSLDDTEHRTSTPHSRAEGATPDSERSDLSSISSNKHAGTYRSARDGCTMRDVPTPEYPVHQKSMDISAEMSRDEEDRAAGDVCNDSTTDSSRCRKRKVAETFLPTEGESGSVRSRPASSSSLEALSLVSENYLTSEGATHTRSENGDQRVLQRVDKPPGEVHSTAEKSDAPTSEKDISRPWKRTPSPLSTPYPDANGSSTEMTVRELEDVVNKHLPTTDVTSEEQDNVLMLKASSHLYPPHHPQHDPRGSAIQWVGGPQPPTLPASSLLRQMYVNRESVIRSGAHASRHSFYGEGQAGGTLPTPPGSEAYPTDQAQFLLPGKMGETDSYGGVASYTPTTSGNGSYVDACNAMTPPSSVSPRDKFLPGAGGNVERTTSAFTEAAAVAAAAAIPHMRHHHHHPYVSDTSLQHLALKPQLFVHPGNFDPSAYGHAQQAAAALAGPEQHQIYHPSSFHLYHPTATATAGKSHHSPNGASWFCQPHS